VKSAHFADVCTERQKRMLEVVDDMKCPVGGSLASQSQFAEKLADPKTVHVHKQVTAVPRLRKERTMLLNSKFETRRLETLNNYFTFTLS